MLNSDQTPSLYVLVGKLTMPPKGVKSVPIKGLTDKRNITLTFTVTLSGKFFPLQIIYGGKADACHPRGFVFLFSITHNPGHWSNKKETLKFINEIVNTYVVKTRKELGLDSAQKACGTCLKVK